MKSQHNKQEILLFTDTSFANRELRTPTTENREGRYISSHDKLEKACWDGLLSEMLPEVVGAADSKRENYIWQITSAENFLCISMGAYDMPIMSRSSIDPYYFITSVPLN